MNITMLDGHPDSQSLVTSLLDAYAEGAEDAGHEVRRVVIRDLDFDPVLRGYRDRRPLEPSLAEAQQEIAWCEHLVLGFPVWWGAAPALTKGFVDRTFLPGWAFQFHEKGPWWDRLLAGRSARMIVTSATPAWVMKLGYRNAPIAATRDSVLAFCGFRPVRVSHFGGVNKHFAESRAARWLTHAERLGRAGR